MKDHIRSKQGGANSSKYVIEAELIVKILPNMKYEKVLKRFAGLHTEEGNVFSTGCHVL